MAPVYENEGYYQKIIDLQEKLRKSEEERMKLEEKFNHMISVTRDEQQRRLKKLRARYKKFLEENKQRNERNDKILRHLDNLENRAAMLTAKTDRLRLLRKQYSTYIRSKFAENERNPEEILPIHVIEKQQATLIFPPSKYSNVQPTQPPEYIERGIPTQFDNKCRYDQIRSVPLVDEQPIRNPFTVRFDQKSILEPKYLPNQYAPDHHTFKYPHRDIPPQQQINGHTPQSNYTRMYSNDADENYFANQEPHQRKPDTVREQYENKNDHQKYKRESSQIRETPISRTPIHREPPHSREPPYIPPKRETKYPEDYSSEDSDLKYTSDYLRDGKVKLPHQIDSNKISTDIEKTPMPEIRSESRDSSLKRRESLLKNIKKIKNDEEDSVVERYLKEVAANDTDQPEIIYDNEKDLQQPKEIDLIVKQDSKSDEYPILDTKPLTKQGSFKESVSSRNSSEKEIKLAREDSKISIKTDNVLEEALQELPDTVKEQLYTDVPEEMITSVQDIQETSETPQIVAQEPVYQNETEQDVEYDIQQEQENVEYTVSQPDAIEYTTEQDGVEYVQYQQPDTGLNYEGQQYEEYKEEQQVDGQEYYEQQPQDQEYYEQQPQDQQYYDGQLEQKPVEYYEGAEQESYPEQPEISGGEPQQSIPEQQPVEYYEGAAVPTEYTDENVYEGEPQPDYQEQYEQQQQPVEYYEGTEQQEYAPQQEIYEGDPQQNYPEQQYQQEGYEGQEQPVYEEGQPQPGYDQQYYEQPEGYDQQGDAQYAPQEGNYYQEGQYEEYAQGQQEGDQYVDQQYVQPETGYEGYVGEGYETTEAEQPVQLTEQVDAQPDQLPDSSTIQTKDAEETILTKQLPNLANMLDSDTDSLQQVSDQQKVSESDFDFSVSEKA